METTNPTLTSAILLCSILMSQAAIADSSVERESRSKRIVALQKIIHDSRVDRSKRLQAKLDLARLQAEVRKDKRNSRGGSGSASQRGGRTCY